MQKTYVYKHYSGNDYIGIIEVSSEFTFTNEMNSAGSQIVLDLPISLQDAMPTREVDRLVDENGNYVIDEQNNYIATRVDYSVVGIPSLGDNIQVWEFSDDYPNGKRMFNGLVSKWNADYTSNIIKVYVLSYGVQLDNYLIQILPEDTLTQNSIAFSSSTQTLYAGWKTPQNRITGGGETFTIPADSEVTTIYVSIGNSGNFSVPATLSLVEGTPTDPSSVLATVTRNIPVQDETLTAFQFATPIALQTGATYHFTVINDAFGLDDTNSFYLGVDTGANYASGTAYLHNDSSGWASSANDLCFKVVSSSGAIGNQFNSYDPSDILRSLMDSFIALGGNLDYTDSSIETTNTTVSYTFKFNTYLEGVKKVIELAPAYWYWYIDQAENIVYFKSRSSSPDHTLILGSHTENILFEYSLENIVNKVYFSGGDDGSGDNLVTYNSNNASVTRYGSWLSLPSDNRVTLEETANTLSQAILNEKSVPKFSSEVTILASDYDITSFHIGQIIAFSNSNELVDDLTLQIYSLEYHPDYVKLVLEYLPPTQSKRIEDIRRNLLKQQTENNPGDT